MNTDLSLGAKSQCSDFFGVEDCEAVDLSHEAEQHSDTDGFTDLCLNSTDLQRISTEASESPTRPSSRGLCYYLQMLLSYLCGTYGPKMSPHAVNCARDKIFSQDKGWEPSEIMHELGDTRTAKFVKKTVTSEEGKEKTLIISCVGHDLPDSANGMETARAGGVPASQLINDAIGMCPAGDVKLLIPVAQSCDYLFGHRHHFVTLSVDIRDGRVEAVQLIDSKGCDTGELFYDGLDKIRQQVTEAEVPLAQGCNFLFWARGDQGALNNSDCGRFTLCHIAQITDQAEAQLVVVQPHSFFRDNQDPLNLYPWRRRHRP